MNKHQKRLLIAGGGYADIPLILAGKKLGYRVISSGNRPGELGHQYADEYRPADFSDPDAILHLARDLNVSAICACCNDFSALSAAYAAEKMGLPGHDNYETARIIHHKDLYRKFAHEHGIPAPQAMGFSTKPEALAGMLQMPLPLIVKPVDLTGGKGMSTIRERAEEEAAVEKAFSISRSKRIVAEEFIEGSRHGFSAFLVDGRVVFHFSDNEHYFLNPYLVSGASVPSIVSPEIETMLCAETEKIAGLLSLKPGIFHVQFILHNGRPVIIEICRRAPGDLYIRLVELATGVDYASWIVRASAGLDCTDLRQACTKGFFLRHCVMSAKPGRIRNVAIDQSVEKNIVEQYMWWKTGDEIGDAMTAKAGIVFLRFESMDEMLDRAERMQELIRVDMEYA